MPMRHRDPVREHSSLVQSGVVQARMARKPSHFARASSVVVRSFDDGRGVGLPRHSANDHGAGPAEYDCATANPSLNATAYLGAPLGTAMGTDGGEVCDVAAANPAFDATLYEDESGTRPAPQPGRIQDEPTVRRTKTSPSVVRPREAPETAPASAKSFTARELSKLVKDGDFQADLDAILNGRDRLKPRAAAQPASRAASKQSARSAQTEPEAITPSAEDVAAALSEKPNEHAIFDKIAQNMRYATAYELAPVNLGHRFDRFDRQGPRRPPAARAETQARQSSTPRAAPSAPPEPASDNSPRAAPSQVPPGMPPAAQPEDPPTPPTLRPYSEAERVSAYGDPRPDPEAWTTENVIAVQIPQLAGIPMGDGTPSDGNVAFHKLGARSLTDLFAAWELAGLMSRVLTFDAAHVADAPHSGADAHAWAVAFDINAKWNPASAEPAAIGDKGSVLELIEIANRHGFVWGGYDPRRKAGLHFELGQRI